MAQAQAQRSTASVIGGADAADRSASASSTPSLSWEPDFWGKYRRATEAARAQILASEWGRRAILTSLVSARWRRGYFTLRALDLELEIAQRTLASRQESLRLTEVRERGGATSLVDVRQAEQLVHTAQRRRSSISSGRSSSRRTPSASCSDGIRDRSRAAAR